MGTTGSLSALNWPVVQRWRTIAEQNSTRNNIEPKTAVFHILDPDELWWLERVSYLDGRQDTFNIFYHIDYTPSLFSGFLEFSLSIFYCNFELGEVEDTVLVIVGLKDVLEKLFLLYKGSEKSHCRIKLFLSPSWRQYQTVCIGICTPVGVPEIEIDQGSKRLSPSHGISSPYGLSMEQCCSTMSLSIWDTCILKTKKMWNLLKMAF